ncbi:hypothetical protein ENHY17A_10026 [Moraxellaceae bacterium 17A]|nr:hypothetical protein ENHY17A_10026 [Moraxellaceae bacterium 17A]
MFLSLQQLQQLLHTYSHKGLLCCNAPKTHYNTLQQIRQFLFTKTILL